MAIGQCTYSIKLVFEYTLPLNSMAVQPLCDYLYYILYHSIYTLYGTIPYLKLHSISHSYLTLYCTLYYTLCHTLYCTLYFALDCIQNFIHMIIT
jgi:hypothetical protein